MRLIAAARQLGPRKAEGIFPASSEFNFLVRSSFKPGPLLKNAEQFAVKESVLRIPLKLKPTDLADTPYAGYCCLAYHQQASAPSQRFFPEGQANATVFLVVECDEGEEVSLEQTRKLITNAIDPDITLKAIAERINVYAEYGDRHTANVAVTVVETQEELARTITKAVQRGETIDKIQAKSEDLLASAQQFELTAHRFEEGCWPFNVLSRFVSSSCVLS